MKRQSKFLLIALGIIVIMSFSFGCAKESENPVDNNDDIVIKEPVNISAGFVNDKYIENDNMIVEFGYVKGEDDAYDGNLILTTDDSDLFNDVELLDHYMLTYDDDNNLISIENNEVIKEFMDIALEEDIENPQEEKEFEVISASENLDNDNLTLLDSFSIDIYGDEEEEKVEMYVDAEKDDQGNIMWDDGQNWKMVVDGSENSFILFEDYLQLSSMDFFVYTIDDEFYISIVKSGTANLTMTEYKYNQENQTFEKIIKSDTSGNVNMLYKSTLGL